MQKIDQFLFSCLFEEYIFTYNKSLSFLVQSTINAHDIRGQILENKFWHEVVVDPHGNVDLLFFHGRHSKLFKKAKEVIIWLMFNILILCLLHRFSHIGNG